MSSTTLVYSNPFNTGSRPYLALTAGAPTQVWEATRACSGFVVGIPQITIDLVPVFSSSPYTLWGRRDFLATFDVGLSEKNQRFTLHW